MPKKALAILLSVLLLFCGTVTFAGLAPQGDANEDGVVTASDAAAILRHLVRLQELTPQGLINADFNLDGAVNAQDAALILRYLVRLYTPPTFRYEGPKMSLADFPKLDGSTATIPLAVALMQYATGCTKAQAEAAISFSTTDYSYYALKEGRADLLLVYEAADAVKDELDFDSNLDLFPIGLDGLVFIVNADNPVNTLTTSQIQGIYSGVITNWKEVGGEDKEIVAFQRPELSGSQTMMTKLVMGDIPMTKQPSKFIPRDMGDLIEAIVEYENTANVIGFSVYYYAQNMYALPGLKFIAVDGAPPNEWSIAAREYPHINEFFGVLSKAPAENAQQLLDYLLTDNGQELLAFCGYVPINPDILPTPLPPPTPASRDMWNKNYYAVLPGPGDNMLVYDCRLRTVGSFTTRGLGIAETMYFKSGMYTAAELAEYALFINGKQLNLDTPRAGLLTQRYANGFYRYDPRAGKLYVYDNTFKLRYTVDHEPDVAPTVIDWIYNSGITPYIEAIGENDWISEFPWWADTVIPEQIRGKNGERIDCPALTSPDLAIRYVFGDKYFIHEYDYEWPHGYKSDICDFNGNILVKDVTPVWYTKFDLPFNYSHDYGCRYYLKDGVLYDSALKMVGPVSLKYRGLSEVGPFFDGAIYDINGVSSTGDVTKSRWGAFIQGYANGNLHVQRDEETYRFPVDSDKVVLIDFNDNFLLLYDTSVWCYEVRFRKSGETFEITLGGSDSGITLSDDYFIVGYWDGWPRWEYHLFIIDKDGNRRFELENDSNWRITAQPGGVIMMQRDFYGCIIADLDGNTLVKGSWDRW